MASQQATIGQIVSIVSVDENTLTEAEKIQEQQLISGCCRGERQAQQRLYQHFYGEMMAVCARYAGNSDEAAEILNDGFLKIFAKIQHFEPTYSLRAWVRRIMINTAIDHYRANRKHQYMLHLDFAGEQIVSDEVVARLSAEEIMTLVQKLPPAYRLVFNLHVIEGYSHPEIAAQLGINEGTSKSNLFKARIKLQTMIRHLYRSSQDPSRHHYAG